MFPKETASTNTDPKTQVLAQLLRQNGGCNVVIAAPEGLKMDLAKKLDAADEYIALSRSNPEEQFEKIKKDNPFGTLLSCEISSQELLFPPELASPVIADWLAMIGMLTGH